MRKSDIKSLYYITHIDNLPSILDRGILSRANVEALNLSPTSVANRNIISKREDKFTSSGKSLWDYANVYFQPRNPILFSLLQSMNLADLAVVGVSNKILQEQDVLITDGNAAADLTQFYSQPQGLTVIQEQWEIIQSDWWIEVPGAKHKIAPGARRKIMAECLVPNRVKPEYIDSIFVANDTAKDRVKRLINNSQIAVVIEPYMFFQPYPQIGDNISLIRGDMFLSKMQTLTITVNLQGTMGKGLALLAKRKFPDVDEVYQKACRAKTVRVGCPYLYKREALFDHKWFLLFATKRHWRENSRLEYIESGLDWVKSNLKDEGIQSLAMPALGCGLGGLDWADVGPMMCRYLHEMGIPVEIYLPHEGEIDFQYLEESYLLPHLEQIPF